MEKSGNMLKVLLFMTFFCFTRLYSLSNAQEIFPEPDIIKDNVRFWRMVYSEVSVKEGLLHDREYPMVIYEKIDLSKISEKEKQKFINSRKNHYSSILKSIPIDTQSNLSDEQQYVLKIFNSNASLEVIEGADDRVRFQSGQMERFILGIERSFMYLDTISSILQKYNLPQQLKYLPHVESSFDPEAYSRVGAAGMWQFMRNTAKLFMTVNYDIDERLDPIKSTDAAARLLDLNYQHLQSWPLAITAYNHGLAGMKNAISKTGSNDIAIILKRHESPSFKFASRNFYASFLAAIRLADSAFHYFPDLKPQKPVPLKLLFITSNLTPAQLCKVAGIPMDTFKKYNPAIRPSVYLQQKVIPSGSTISLPDSIIIPQDAFAMLKVADSNFSKNVAMQNGNYLIDIDKMYGNADSDLAMSDPVENKIYVYTDLMLKQSSDSVKLLKTPVESFQLINTSDTTGMIKINEPSVDSSHLDEMVTLSLIADNIHQIKLSAPKTKEKIVTYESIDNITNKGITYNDLSRFDTSTYDFGLKFLSDSSMVIIKVNVGESVVRYADWMNITVSAIIRLNGMKNYRLKLGSSIKLPNITQGNIKKFHKDRTEYHMAIEEDFYSRYEIVGELNYTLKRGDTFWKISSQNHIPLWLLKKINRNVEFSFMQKGVKIRIPQVAPKGIHEPPLLEDAPSGEIILQKETFESLEEVKE